MRSLAGVSLCGQLVGILISAALVAWDPGTYQVFLIPKILLVNVLAILCALFLSLGGEVQFPSRRVAAFIGVLLLCGAVLGLRSAAPMRSGSSFAMLLACVLIWCGIRTLGDRSAEIIKAWIAVTAVAEAGVGMLQAARPGHFLGEYNDTGHPGSIGTLGNPEFLATLCGVGSLLSLECAARSRTGWGAWRWRVSAVAAAAGVLLARNKGGLILLAFFCLRRGKALRRWEILTGVAGCCAIVWVFPEPIRGRLHLLTTDAWMFATHPLMGTGLASYGHYYLDAVYQVHSRSSWIRTAFGSHTSDVRDAHNVLLEWGIAMGIGGVALAMGLVWHTAKVAFGLGGAAGAALGYLLCKSQYTVVLGAVPGALLWTTCLATIQRRRSAFCLPLDKAWKRFAILLPVPVLIWCGSSAAIADRDYANGMRELLRGQDIPARRYFEHSVSWNPDNAEAYLSLGFIEYRQRRLAAMDGRLLEAMQAEKTIDVTKKSAHMWYFTGQFEKAEPIYRWLAMAMPDRRSPLIKLALIAEAQGRHAESLRLAGQVVSMRPRVYNPNDAEYLVQAYRILRR